jgi:hypothetical protein
MNGGGGGGGVTQILTGSGVTISPSNGIGVVTISSTGGIDTATANQINNGSTGSFYIRPLELETSKYTAINVFNYLNFT